ncbi:hypothetical protein DBZ36_13220 [Alginatibacterium sediminis]|uniref:PEP-CTERM sorting domain-containing protein n=1 Tax=Alginatibacterium sediminis TaxID=2164068 RepID=A0A420E9R2_9ALTE|nr:hypothetical protein [Alginatibacterium sediminis]RKF17413.1 hypothetical protein DBZ36_13220 [Alginatibacterium sediminis]
MSISTVNLAFASMLTLFSGLVHAGLIIDSDGLENLEWFDFNLTEGLSRVQVENLIDTSSEFEGYRYASVEETSLLFDTIFSSVGISENADSGSVVLNDTNRGIDLHDDFEMFFQISEDKLSRYFVKTGINSGEYRYKVTNYMLFGGALTTGRFNEISLTRQTHWDIFYGTDVNTAESVYRHNDNSYDPSNGGVKSFATSIWDDPNEVTTSLLVKSIKGSGPAVSVNESTSLTFFTIAIIGLTRRHFRLKSRS